MAASRWVGQNRLGALERGPLQAPAGGNRPLGDFRSGGDGLHAGRPGGREAHGAQGRTTCGRRRPSQGCGFSRSLGRCHGSPGGAVDDGGVPGDGRLGDLAGDERQQPQRGPQDENHHRLDDRRDSGGQDDRSHHVGQNHQGGNGANLLHD